MAKKTGISPIILYGVPAIALLSFFGRKQIAAGAKIAAGFIMDEANALLFKTKALIGGASKYADVILRVAQEKGIDPFAIYALGSRESLWGEAPAYKQDTGDWASRCRTQGQIDKYPGVYKVLDSPCLDKDGKPIAGLVRVMPADGLGWGRGLMQIDWEMQRDWMNKYDWRDPYQNVSGGAFIFKQFLDLFGSISPIYLYSDGKTVTVPKAYAARFNKTGGTFPDPRPLTGKALAGAAIAAYNAGAGSVICNLVLGLPADASTTGADYSADTTKRMNDAIARFVAAGGRTAAV